MYKLCGCCLLVAQNDRGLSLEEPAFAQPGPLPGFVFADFTCNTAMLQNRMFAISFIVEPVTFKTIIPCNVLTNK